MSFFFEDCKLKLIPDISSELLEEMISTIKPVLQTADGFKVIKTKGVDRENIAYTWEPKLGRKVDLYTDGLNCRDIITFHKCGYYGFFKPSLKETYACVNAFVQNWRKHVRYIWLDSANMDARNVIAGGTHQYCRCVIFGYRE